MPSKSLQNLNHQIKLNSADSLTRFYHYSAILALIATNKDNFKEMLPRKIVESNLFSSNELEIDSHLLLNEQFNSESSEYARSFHQRKNFGSWQNYIGQGAFSDVGFLMEKMVTELETIHENNLSLKSQTIFNSIEMQLAKHDLLPILKSSQLFNQNLLQATIIDLEQKVSLALGIAAAITMLFVANIFVVVALSIVTAASLYTSINKIKEVDKVKNSIETSMNSLYRKLNSEGIAEKFYGSSKSYSFFGKTLIKPALCLPFTLIDKIADGKNDQITDTQAKINNTFDQLDTSFSF